MVVGKPLSFWGPAYFRGELLVSGRIHHAVWSLKKDLLTFSAKTIIKTPQIGTSFIFSCHRWLSTSACPKPRCFAASVQVRQFSVLLEFFEFSLFCLRTPGFFSRRRPLFFVENHFGFKVQFFFSLRVRLNVGRKMFARPKNSPGWFPTLFTDKLSD